MKITFLIVSLIMIIAVCGISTADAAQITFENEIHDWTSYPFYYDGTSGLYHDGPMTPFELPNNVDPNYEGPFDVIQFSYTPPAYGEMVELFLVDYGTSSMFFTTTDITLYYYGTYTNGEWWDYTATFTGATDWAGSSAVFDGAFDFRIDTSNNPPVGEITYFGIGHYSGPNSGGTITYEASGGGPAPVPEPATMTIFGLGILGLAVKRFRK